MQQQLNKKIYNEFVYSNPTEHLLTPNNLTRPPHRYKKISTKFHLSNSSDVGSNNLSGNHISVDVNKAQQLRFENCNENNVNINLATPQVNPPQVNPQVSPQVNQQTEIEKPKPIIYDEDTFNQIELRGFITKDLLKQSLIRKSNLFHIAKDIFEKMVEKYDEFTEMIRVLETEFDNTLECVKDTIKELIKKINHIIYELYKEVMNKKID